MNKQDWIDTYNEKHCTCKNASRNNSCKGLITCTLRADHPERKAMHVEDFKKLWASRPKGEKLSIQNCPVYAFDNSGRVGWMVFIHPAHYRPKDWRGLI